MKRLTERLSERTIQKEHFSLQQVRQQEMAAGLQYILNVCLSITDMYFSDITKMHMISNTFWYY